MRSEGDCYKANKPVRTLFLPLPCLEGKVVRVTEFAILAKARDDCDGAGAVEKAVGLPVGGCVQNERIPLSTDEGMQAPCVGHVEAELDGTVEREQASVSKTNE